MSEKVDINIAFYGKPYQAIVTIKTLMKYSSQHIDKIYLSRERFQPHNDYSGIFKVIDYFRNDPTVKLIIQYPHHFLGLNAKDYQRAKIDIPYRQSILYQYPLEVSDKKYVVVVHNDMLFHGDMIGDMLKTFADGPQNVASIGSIGQCWSCPAGPDWGGKCNSKLFEQFVPTKEEAIVLTKNHATPRRDLQLQIIEAGRVHILPECRINDYCAMFDVEKYRKETLPNGDIGCYGGHWNGVDICTIWSHDMFSRGYTFRHLSLEDYVRHAAFDTTGSGTKANSSADTYWNAERNAEKYITENFGTLNFTPYVSLATAYDAFKRKSWLALIHTYGFVKKLIGK